VEFGQVRTWTLPHPALLLSSFSPHPPTASALAQHHIIRYLHFIYHSSLHSLLSATLWLMLKLTPSSLPIPEHVSAVVSTYITSISSLLMFYCVFHAPSPLQHGFFQPSTWMMSFMLRPYFPKGKYIGESLWWFLGVFAHFLSISISPALTNIPPTCLPHQLLFYCLMLWGELVCYYFCLFCCLVGIPVV